MNPLRLIIRNIRYYFRTWILVAAGAMIGTAVLTGALIIGDSVKYSLERKVSQRLGNTRFALTSPDKFFRTALGRELSDSLKCRVVSLVLSEGMATNPERKISLGRVSVIGVDETFSQVWAGKSGTAIPISPKGDEAFLGQSLAARLKVKMGEILLLKVRKAGFAPGNAPFVYEKIPAVVVRLKVKGIADENTGGGFSLLSNQSPAGNVFISRELLASLLGMPGFVNTLLVSPENAVIDQGKLDRSLKNLWNYEDAGLVLKKLQDSVAIFPGEGGRKKNPVTAGVLAKKVIPAKKATQVKQGIQSNKGAPATMNAGSLYQLSSGRVFIQDTIARAVLRELPGSEGILTYLVNDLRAGVKSTPYSFVSAVASGPGGLNLKDNEIIINDWLASDLQVKAGDSLTIRYFTAGFSGKLKEKSCNFIIGSIAGIQSFLFSGDLMPGFPGIKNTSNCRDWETGTDIDLSRIRDKDDAYWKKFRGTPKAFISLQEGQMIWHNPFGTCTAIRFPTNEKDAGVMITTIIRKIPPSALGLAFIPVYDQGLNSARNSNDMGGLFLSLGILIIISGLLLSWMMFSFFIQSRTEEAALLSSTGFRKRKILGLFVSEAMIFSIMASMAGILLATGYSRLMLYALNTVWQGAVHTTLLSVHLRPGTMAAGFLSGILISMVVFSLVLTRSLRRPLASAIRIPASGENGKPGTKGSISLLISVLSLASALTLIMAGVLRAGLLSPELFMAAGFLFIPGMVSLVYWWLIKPRPGFHDNKNGWISFVFRNAGINRSRTITAVTMLALGTFTILITGANRKISGNEAGSNTSGTGGFLLWIQSSIPLRPNLDSQGGRKEAGLEDEPLLKNLRFVDLCTVNGEDASCLNLNRVKAPQLLGVPCSLFDKLEAFSFTGLAMGTCRDHPWMELQEQKTGKIIPGYADQTVITWGLGKKLGDTVFYRDEEGTTIGIYLAGALDNSIFQGNILVSDSLLRKFYPSSCITNIVLARKPEGKTGFNDAPSVKNRGHDNSGGGIAPLCILLETRLYNYGAIVTPAASRLEEFNSVENTYISVFMMLGGLGVLLGTIGLGLLMLKNMLERRFEAALYTALGFPEKLRKKLVFYEYFFILLAGLFIGITASLIGSIPVILTSTITLPWGFMICLLSLLFFNGIFWIYVAMGFLPGSDPAKILRSE
jgi:ABC-type antimicrobial peptide transport system permease subunit